MRIRMAIFGSALAICASSSAWAQAYLEEPGSLSAGVAYLFAPSGQIVSTTTGDNDGFNDYQPNATVFAHQINFSAEYMTPIRGLGVEVTVPLLGVKVGEGSFDHFPAPGPYDDGDMHWTLTDFRGNVRYQIKAIEEYLGLSFMAGTSIPMRDYATSGFAVAGTHLKIFHVGTAIARTLDPLIPRMFFQIEYEYAFREKLDVSPETEKFGRNYSDFAFSLGYFLPANFTLAAAGNMRLSHGGASFSQLVLEPPVVQDHHDQLLSEQFLLVGGDLGYDFSETLSLAAVTRFFVWGENTRNQNIFGISATYSFL